MSEVKFTKLLDYDAIKQQFGDEDDQSKQSTASTQINGFDPEQRLFADSTEEKKKPSLTGSRLRSYAFAVLTRKEYAKAELIEKLCLYAEDRNEVLELVDELSRENYQSDQRVAETMLSSQKRKGKGPNQIKMKLKSKKIDTALIAEELKETDWVQQAYELKVKKYGVEVSRDPKIKAKQIRFLMYRGFEMDAIIKAINCKLDDE
ncbi:RecX family transcriptional regulator [Acinetobacter sp. NCu2D-2]|uniref:regulatory protein RecX n=1 Tax=Acinetobacter sp. NCu2D-2 TaxID=1608473 RepID=UPI0007CDEAA4|nr:regulatory protein RecX [Acinetobacter sp. NCu2D-2]ANF81658.1 RecX family transcriptional regulator [Acinetobacter sp. NCu2D-2]